MGYMIAITGKGGSGKTTVAGVIVNCLIELGRAPVLAVDADPNSCLDGVLGMRVTSTVGSAREELRRYVTGATQSTPKRDYLEMKIAESLVEGEDLDLIAMGRPEGPGCYCYANSLLKDIIAAISSGYPSIVIDNEAGLENLSRRIVRRTDLLVMVADPSRRGLETVRRLHSLAQEMNIEYGTLAVIVNRVQTGYPPAPPLTEADRTILLPEDGEILELDGKGLPLSRLSANNPVRLIIMDVLRHLPLGEIYEETDPGARRKGK